MAPLLIFPFQRPVRDGDYLGAFNHMILPILYEFRPELTIIAAGFDAVRGDHLVSPDKRKLILPSKFEPIYGYCVCFIERDNNPHCLSFLRVE